MALWPFGKKSSEKSSEDTPASEPEVASAESTEASLNNEAPVAQPDPAEKGANETEAPLASGVSEGFEHDPVNGNVGPFDGDSVEFNDFDFSDFGVSVLNLGSLRIPLPKDTQVQVEMGDQGPKMLHIVTRHGRITPVAFAAPSSGGQWERSVEEISDGMRQQGMPTKMELGPWGREVVGTGVNGSIRIIGVDGPRWMLRMTLASPEGKEVELATLGRELTARVFVYRGNDPILAGNSLPVILPQQLAQQVQQAVQQRAQQPAQGQPAQQQMPDAMRRLMDGDEENKRP
ncbi:DUF3710 domain-containing protein [Corynebacterium lubricantis]|uniref:DUF3710 domain-containing protein n=1 Tax=Corynebacterium lubricantis TaxID=541095 RepID=UPI00036DF39B|nr:DUF3710 domain-containing protein [Corynebacterium lubricantis]